MKVFVTGGTGFVGREVVLHLAASGHKPVLLVRNPASQSIRDLAGRAHANLAPGDIMDPSSLKAIAGVDAVIHLVGIISEVGRTTFENVHTRGTQNMIAGTQAAGVRRFIHMSALGTRESAVSRYHKTKWQAEEAVRHSGLDYTIFRPSIIYGPDDMFVNQFANIAKWSPFLPVMGNGSGTLQPVGVAEVAQCFVRALTEPASVGKTFDLCGPEVLTFTQVLDAIMAASGRKRMKIKIPLPLARTMAGTAEFVFQKLLHKQPPLNQDQVTMLQEKTVGDGRPAVELFGVRPARFADGISWLKSGV